jgi:predicted AAA+ superfamily ATPase
MLPEWSYVNLEDPDSQDFALSDPKGFLRLYSDQVILDEIQRVPKLLSYLQVEVDRDRRPGRFALTGSHNLLLLEQVSQSLAGRTTVRHLLPFSYDELAQADLAPKTLEDALFAGGYPMAQAGSDTAVAWLDSYVQTYVERDVRMIRNVADLSTFRRFLRLCAGRASQLLDLSGIGGDAGISHNTVNQWIGVLEAGFIAFRLEPYFKSFSKRIIKSPKLYFYDTGLLCRLLDIRSPRDLVLSPFRGAIFENWCLVEALKWHHNHGQRAGLYFWRDQSMEVDILAEKGSLHLVAIECKSSVTPPADALKNPVALASIMKGNQIDPAVVFGGDESQSRTQGTLFSWRDFGSGAIWQG